LMLQNYFLRLQTQFVTTKLFADTN
jgi:hypothetical protein